MPEEQLHIRFKGICTHIDLGQGDANNRKMRTVLVRGVHGDCIEHHVAYIEFYADDLEDDGLPPQLEAVTYTRPANDGVLARIDLVDPVEIRLNATAGLVQQDRFFKHDIPALSELMGTVIVKPGVLTAEAAKVDRSLVSAVIDLPQGRIQAGEPEGMLTRFDPKIGFKERRLARWADLFVTVQDSPRIELVPLTEGQPSMVVKFKPTTRMITIGNEPERMILGLFSQSAGESAGHGVHHGSARSQNASPTQPTGHYAMFYNLVENAPASPPVPIPTQLLGSGCPNGNLP